MPTQRPLYREIAHFLAAIRNCRQNDNPEWLERHKKSLQKLLNLLPSGSGIDRGTKLEEDLCTDRKLVFSFGFHHMDEHGYYTTWTEHRLTITPSFDGIDLHISGRDKNGVKEYLYETYHYALYQMVDVS